MNLFMDIETIPPTTGDHMARIRAEIKPPGQYKKPESIAEWHKTQGEAAVQEAHAALSLDGLYGEVCVIGFAVDAGQISVVAQKSGEKALLEIVSGLIDESVGSSLSGVAHPVTVVGHNIEWDMRFLRQRAIRLGVKVPRSMLCAFNYPRDFTYDTMRVWAGYKEFVKCRDLARELLGDTTDDIDGSQVAAAWAQNRQLVIDHCHRDVARVRELHAKFNAVL